MLRRYSGSDLRPSRLLPFSNWLQTHSSARLGLFEQVEIQPGSCARRDVLEQRQLSGLEILHRF